MERDTRVRSTAKINIITTTDPAANHLLTNGIRIGTKILYPRSTRPRPPPTRRGYLPNFPVAATEAHLEEVAGEKGIATVKIAPRLHRNTTIKIGGWSIWTDLDCPTPDTLHFDGEEYAILWRSKKTTDPNRSGPTASNTGRSTERPIAAKRPDITTTDIDDGEAAEAEREEVPAPQTATTNQTRDEDMRSWRVSQRRGDDVDRGGRRRRTRTTTTTTKRPTRITRTGRQPPRRRTSTRLNELNGCTWVRRMFYSLTFRGELAPAP